ncbi:MAG TPA: hypothetical protein VLG49_00925 [Rhabdochlamydiaceae bacterium]|nr:hypothetical protein [Rhabdochlamydiaceae bacterium]
MDLNIRPSAPGKVPQPPQKLPKQLQADVDLTKKVADRTIPRSGMRKEEAHHNWEKGMRNKVVEITAQVAQRGLVLGHQRKK